MNPISISRVGPKKPYSPGVDIYKELNISNSSRDNRISRAVSHWSTAIGILRYIYRHRIRRFKLRWIVRNLMRALRKSYGAIYKAFMRIVELCRYGLKLIERVGREYKANLKLIGVILSILRVIKSNGLAFRCGGRGFCVLRLHSRSARDLLSFVGSVSSVMHYVYGVLVDLFYSSLGLGIPRSLVSRAIRYGVRDARSVLTGSIVRIGHHGVRLYANGGIVKDVDVRNAEFGSDIYLSRCIRRIFYQIGSRIDRLWSSIKLGKYDGLGDAIYLYAFIYESLRLLLKNLKRVARRFYSVREIRKAIHNGVVELFRFLAGSERRYSIVGIFNRHKIALDSDDISIPIERKRMEIEDVKNGMEPPWISLKFYTASYRDIAKRPLTTFSLARIS